jgi:hypothetical protein
MNAVKFNIGLSKTNLLNPAIAANGLSRHEFTSGAENFAFFYCPQCAALDLGTKDPVEFVKRNNGLLLSFSKGCLRLYNDPFRTIPVYLCRSGDSLRIFSNFTDFYSFPRAGSSTIDTAGFWETVIFEGALGTRTLFENLKQMPAASVLSVNPDLDYSIARYWDFSIEADSSINTKEKAAEGLYERLDAIFKRLPKSKKYLLGLSGGIDSRLTLAMLNRHFSKDQLMLFTYGYDENILEYVYAKQIAKALGFNPPVFHKLTAQSYTECADDMAHESGAAVGMQHCHMYDFLRNSVYAGPECSLISTAYTDAIFGYAVTEQKVEKQLADTSQYKSLLRYRDLIDDGTFEVIRTDLEDVFADYDIHANFSCPEEYFYCTERNQKFHLNMAYIWKKYMPTLVPYADYSLFKYCIGMPLEFRFHKHIVDAVFDGYFSKISAARFMNISSRDFEKTALRHRWNGKLGSYYHFKLLNRINALLVLLTNGRFQVFNRYQTEKQVANLASSHKSLLYQALSDLRDLKLIGDNAFEAFRRLPYRPVGVSERYQLINISKAIKADRVGKEKRFPNYSKY